MFRGTKNRIFLKRDCNKPLILQHAKPDFESSIRMIDLYIGRVDGFAYGSFQRYLKMKKKGLVKPVSPAEVYRLPIASSHDVNNLIKYIV